jgi:hypothetical protein
MRQLDRLRLLECPDHAVLAQPWRYDVLSLRCRWEIGEGGLALDVRLAMPLGRAAVGLRFRGVTALHLDGDFPLLGLRLIDASPRRAELPGAVCAVHYRWNARDESEPYFWAAAVERLTHPVADGARESDGALR